MASLLVTRWIDGWRARHATRIVVAVAVVAAGAVVGIAGCSAILGVESDRHVAAEAGAQGVDSGGQAIEAGAGAGGDPWDCLAQPDQLFSSAATTTVTLIVVDAVQPITQAEKVDGGSGLDFVSYGALQGIPVRACSSVLAPLCDQGTATPPDGYETTDDAGTATFTLPQDWNGFYQFGDPNLFTTTSYPGRMIAGEDQVKVGVPVLTTMGEAELESFFPAALSHDLDGGVGHVLVAVYDCQDHFASGVQFVTGAATDAGPYPTTVFYLHGAGGLEFPSPSAEATDQGGAGGIINVPVGNVPLTAYLEATDAAPARQIGSVTVFVNPGVATQVVFRPRTH